MRLLPSTKRLVVAERVYQGGCFFFEGVVTASLRTKYGGLNSAHIPDTVEAAEYTDITVIIYLRPAREKGYRCRLQRGRQPGSSLVAEAANAEGHAEPDSEGITGVPVALRAVFPGKIPCRQRLEPGSVRPPWWRAYELNRLVRSVSIARESWKLSFRRWPLGAR